MSEELSEASRRGIDEVDTTKALLSAGVVISTKNRRDELRVALGSCIAQDRALEILVIDDGSADGTSEMVRRDFPNARLARHESSKGLVVSRNEAAQLALSEVIFPSMMTRRSHLAISSNKSSPSSMILVWALSQFLMQTLIVMGSNGKGRPINHKSG